jgi:ferredoxin-NADP reductase
MLLLKSVNFEQRQFQHHCLEQTYSGQVEWVVGRSRTCDLVLPNPEVSRIHGRIVYAESTYYFIDNGSTSGSLLNGESVPANDMRQLHPGDLLQLGETFLYVEELADPSPAASTSAPTVSPFHTHPQQQWTDEDLVCRCCRIVDETPDVKTFYFVAEPVVLFSYLPGQFVNLQLEIDGKSVIRPYSISSSPTRPYHLSITVKRVAAPGDRPDIPAGMVSNWLHDHFKVGDRVQLINGPLGHFTCLPELPSKLLLISAGSGITPMMSMTRWVQDTLADSDVIFLHSARTPEDVVFRAELEAIAAQMPNFHLAITVTQQILGRSWMGLTGRVSESMLHLVAPDLMERTVYVCGPQGFMQGIRAILESLQFPMQNYYEESFGSPAPKIPSNSSRSNSQTQTELEKTTLPTLNGEDSPTLTQILPASDTPVVHFIHSERSVSADSDTSILEIAEQEGVQIRHACRVGACGACKVRICQGEVQYFTTPAALSTADQQAGYALACVAYPASNVAIEV